MCVCVCVCVSLARKTVRALRMVEIDARRSQKKALKVNFHSRETSPPVSHTPGSPGRYHEFATKQLFHRFRETCRHRTDHRRRAQHTETERQWNRHQEQLAQYDIIVGTAWPHLRAKVRRRRLKKATPAGPKKEAPGVKFDPPGVQFRVLGSPKRGFWRPPGASWAPGRPQEGALGEIRAVGKLYGGLLGHLGVIFETNLGAQAER